jgi:predicted DNA-binding transcriptional regulator AlpA
MSERTEVKFLKLSQVLARYGFSRSTLYRLIGRRAFPCAKELSDRTKRWLIEDLDNYDDGLPLAVIAEPNRNN